MVTTPGPDIELTAARHEGTKVAKEVLKPRQQLENTRAPEHSGNFDRLEFTCAICVELEAD